MKKPHVKIAIEQNVNVWSFRALGPKGEALMRKLFPSAPRWLGRTMYADNTYNVQCARILEENGAKLVRRAA
jgi:hypothetical protein